MWETTAADIEVGGDFLRETTAGVAEASRARAGVAAGRMETVCSYSCILPFLSIFTQNYDELYVLP
jgi:hypothetical protein